MSHGSGKDGYVLGECNPRTGRTAATFLGEPPCGPDGKVNRGAPPSWLRLCARPLEDNSAALSFAEDLFAGKFDVVIFLTGVGTRILFGAVETKYSRERLVEALSRLPVVARGPKPVAALREFGVPMP
jgi:Uroporphyrinogen-III synthase HemD